MVSLIKRLARRILREELAAQRLDFAITTDILVEDVRSARSVLNATRKEADRAHARANNLQRHIDVMRQWGSQHGETLPIAWADLLNYRPHGGSWRNTDCVHPFDRWGITAPKP